METSFKAYLKGRKIKLRPWQKELADEVLKRIKPHRVGSTGKTYILTLLLDFINEHGNAFTID